MAAAVATWDQRGQAITLLLAALLVRSLLDARDNADLLDVASLSVTTLLRTFQDTPQYMHAAGWNLDGSTFVPDKPPKLENSTKVNPNRPIRLKRYGARVSRRRACGVARVRDLHHVSAIMPGVDPSFVMEALLSPAHGVKWNPGVRKVVLRHQLHISRSTQLVQAFAPEEVVKARNSASKLKHDRTDMFDVTAQVTEMPLPRLVQRVTGPRHSADFIAVRFDCERRRGFTLATSLGTDRLAEAAGVRKGQELCLTAMLAAPVAGGPGGTAFHIVTHFDPQVPTKALRRAVKVAVSRLLRETIRAIHKKAHSVQQQEGSHTWVACEPGALLAVRYGSPSVYGFRSGSLAPGPQHLPLAKWRMHKGGPQADAD
eukprot:CAMPEP_0171137478 /NCGR_PEP_ID=MMETSP0766_2-20121228/133421_1 /TAXON_ID=439317 /ORGANISM="Gambierdiscus australes, Strain CAWD 149" /LENGTH=371 /DNA_ID=CAMNT_0011601059 /DNA_START=67 /DNA_END=1181 /DNA_ORIENTATION=+